MENSLVTYGFNKDREGIEHHKSAQSSDIKKNGNVTAKNYLKESLLSILCGKGLILKFSLLRMVI